MASECLLFPLSRCHSGFRRLRTNSALKILLTSSSHKKTQASQQWSGRPLSEADVNLNSRQVDMFGWARRAGTQRGSRILDLVRVAPVHAERPVFAESAL
jgi:hypothetical protein